MYGAVRKSFQRSSSILNAYKLQKIRSGTIPDRCTVSEGSSPALMANALRPKFDSSSNWSFIIDSNGVKITTVELSIKFPISFNIWHLKNLHKLLPFLSHPLTDLGSLCSPDFSLRPMAHMGIRTQANSKATGQRIQD